MPTDYTPLYRGFAGAGGALGAALQQRNMRIREEELAQEKSGILNELIQAGTRASDQPGFIGPQTELEESGLIPFGELPADLRKNAGRFADVIKTYDTIRQETVPDYKTQLVGEDLVAVREGKQGGFPTARKIYQGKGKLGTSKFALSVRGYMEKGYNEGEAIEMAKKDEFNTWLAKQDVEKLTDKEIADFKAGLAKDLEGYRQQNRLELEGTRQANRIELETLRARNRQTYDTKSKKYRIDSWTTPNGQQAREFNLTADTPEELDQQLTSRIRQIDSIVAKIGQAESSLFGLIPGTDFSEQWEQFKAGELPIAQLAISIKGYAIEYVQHLQELNDLRNDKGLYPAYDPGAEPGVEETPDTTGETPEGEGALLYDTGGEDSYTADELWDAWGNLPQFKGMSRTEFEEFLGETYGEAKPQ